MKKGEISIGLLISLLSILIIASVIFAILPQFSSILLKSTDNKCSWSLFLSATSKLAGKEVISPECMHKNVQITDKNITDFFKDTKNGAKMTASLTSDSARKSTTGQNYISYYDNLRTDERNENWYVQSIVAEELRDCWNKVQAGSLNLFDDYETVMEDCSKDDSASSGCKKDVPLYSKIWQSVNNREKVPTFCLLCSRIKFELKTDVNIDNIPYWLAANPMPNSKMSYFEFLKKNTFLHNSGQMYPLFNTLKPQAIVYVKERKFGAIQYANSILTMGGIGASDFLNEDREDVPYRQYSAIFNYEDLPDKCSYLIG